MSKTSFIERQKFRQCLIHTGQILHQKQIECFKWIKTCIKCCMSINNAESSTFYTDFIDLV
ncbi:MAG: hypothetical protein GY714_16235 [Desulfobacterales bacterium]|nr:hypothetical protein [Desulfobacterales bacterium]